MRKFERLILSLLIAISIAGAAILFVFVHRARRNSSESKPSTSMAMEVKKVAKEMGINEMIPQKSDNKKKEDSIEFNFKASEPSPEKPIEEELLERGEDPGAVFYVSRIREALKEGNPKFARELFRQMRKFHSNSVLIEEAKLLLFSKKGQINESQ